MVHNQPYDESVEVSDAEEVASATATPRETNGYHYQPPQEGGGAYREEEEEEEEGSESEDSEEGPHATLSG